MEGLASPFFSLSYQMPSYGMRHLTNNCSSVALYKGYSKIKAAKKTQINWMVIQQVEPCINKFLGRDVLHCKFQ